MSSADSKSSISAIVYANNNPPPDARVLGDLKKDVSMRFSVPLGNVSVLNVDGSMADDNMEIAMAPTKMYVEVLQDNGERTRYDTQLVM